MRVCAHLYVMWLRSQVSSCSLCVDAVLLGMICFSESLSKIKGCFVFLQNKADGCTQGISWLENSLQRMWRYCKSFFSERSIKTVFKLVLNVLR